MRKSDFSSVQMGYLKIAHFNLTRSNILYSKMGYLKINPLNVRSNILYSIMGYHKIAHFRIQVVTSCQVKIGYLKIPYSTFLAGAGEKKSRGNKSFLQGEIFFPCPGEYGIK